MWRSQVRWMTILLIKSFMLNKNMNLNWLQWHLWSRNENENQKMCTIPIVWIWLKWLSDATILHIDFKKKSYPPSNPPPLAKSCVRACEQVVWWSSGVPHPWWRCFSTIKANSTRTVRGVCPRWKINCGKNCYLLYICRLCMVVFSKQTTLLIHIIIHTNGTIKKNYFSHHTLEEKKIPALYGAENFFLSLKTCKKNIPAWPNPPPPLEVKWSLLYILNDLCYFKVTDISLSYTICTSTIGWQKPLCWLHYLE